MLVGFEQTHIDVAVSGGCGHILRDGERDSELSNVFALLGCFSVLFERRDGDARSVKLSGDGDFLIQGLVLLVDAVVFGAGAFSICSCQVSFSNQHLVELLERIDLSDVVSEDCSDGGEFFFQAKDFGGAGGFRLFQFFEQSLGAGLFFAESVEEGVILDAFFEFAILCGKLGILVLHLFFVKFGELSQFFEFFLFFSEFLGVVVAGRKPSEKEKSDEKDGKE